MENITYLENVLKNWKSFVVSHQKFANAIESIITENKMLKEQLTQYNR